MLQVGCIGLTQVALPDGLSPRSDDGAPSRGAGCTGLTQVVLPDAVTDVEGRAFKGCMSTCTGLIHVALPNALTQIEHGANRAFITILAGTTCRRTPCPVSSLSLPFPARLHCERQRVPLLTCASPQWVRQCMRQ